MDAKEVMTSVLEEFVADVEAIGVQVMSEEWFDLHVTYTHAINALCLLRGAIGAEHPVFDYLRKAQ